jgi:hypothetical protein
MPPRKTQINSVIKEPLSKHGAETKSNHRRSPTPVANESLPNTSSRFSINHATVNPSENNKSDKSYPGAQHKRIVVQTQPTPSISANRFTANADAEGYNGADSSDDTTASSDDTSSELYNTIDTYNSTDTEEISTEPTSKRRKQQTSWPVNSMPMQTFTIEQDITHYIADMTIT